MVYNRYRQKIRVGTQQAPYSFMIERSGPSILVEYMKPKRV